MRDKILILDFGSQVTQLIARRIRAAHVYCEIHPHDVTADFIRAFQAKGIILSGGPTSVTDDQNLDVSTVIYDLNIPILGICYGMQLMAKHFGAQIASSSKREFGYATSKICADIDWLAGIEDSRDANNQPLLKVWMSHSDAVNTVPTGFKVFAKTDNCPIVGIAHEKKHWYGVQFHPEVTHTIQGEKLLQRFVTQVCAAKPNWKMNSYADEAIEKIRYLVGKEEVILGLSGGVDSSVAAVLLHKAIGNQLTCVFVDNGLLRKDEAQQVMETFNQHLGVKVIHCDASAQFLRKLAGVTDPEQKRKVIGSEFIAVFTEEEKKLENVKWLAQGTIYPDVIESAGAGKKATATIKSHHNVGGLPDTLNLKLLEPLRELFKDEVRELGIALGLPPSMIHRHPFPGPGLGVRILGEVKQEFAGILRQADDIFIKKLHSVIDKQTNKTWYELTSQAFAVFVPVKTVGVMGDGRTYDYLIALRAIQTTDFMTAHWAHLPYDLLEEVSNQIVNQVKGVNRVVYDISGKPPATIEWE